MYPRFIINRSARLGPHIHKPARVRKNSMIRLHEKYGEGQWLAWCMSLGATVGPEKISFVQPTVLESATIIQGWCATTDSERADRNSTADPTIRTGVCRYRNVPPFRPELGARIQRASVFR
jgi:hypothetical protein